MSDDCTAWTAWHWVALVGSLAWWVLHAAVTRVGTLPDGGRVISTWWLVWMTGAWGVSVLSWLDGRHVWIGAVLCWALVVSGIWYGGRSARRQAWLSAAAHAAHPDVSVEAPQVYELRLALERAERSLAVLDTSLDSPPRVGAG